MKKLTGLLAIGLLVLGFTACSNDDDKVVTPEGPKIVVPEGIVELEVNESKDLTFSIEAPNGISTTEFKTAGGEFFAQDTEEVGSTSKKITGLFIAGEEAGSAAVTLTVTDLEGETVTESIAIIITSEE